MADNFGLGAASFLKGLAGGIQAPQQASSSDSSLLNFLMRMQEAQARAQESALDRQLRERLAGVDQREKHNEARIKALVDNNLMPSFLNWDNLDAKSKLELGKKINALWGLVDTSYGIKGNKIPLDDVEKELKAQADKQNVPKKGFDFEKILFGKSGGGYAGKVVKGTAKVVGEGLGQIGKTAKESFESGGAIGFVPEYFNRSLANIGQPMVEGLQKGIGSVTESQPVEELLVKAMQKGLIK